MATELNLQMEQTIRKIADKYAASTDNAAVFTDIHLRVNQETAELVAYDDDDSELARTVIEEWINNTDYEFLDNIQADLRKVIESHKSILENISIQKPYSFILENEDKEHVAELYIVDDDIAILDTELLKGLDEDMNKFLEELLK